jgi:hypothetical protein
MKPSAFNLGVEVGFLQRSLGQERNEKYSIINKPEKQKMFSLS